MGLIVATGHFERPDVKRIAKKVEGELQKHGANCKAVDIKGKKFNGKNVELVVVVGGDGSLLRVVRELQGERPVVGIAAGEQSALMQIKLNQLERKLGRIARRKFRIQKRLRLQAVADGKKLPPALNEVMLVNKKSGAIISYCLQINGREAYRCKADGCIIATPTGSTGHSYSAGGKRLELGSKKMAIVPSNPLNRAVKPLYKSRGCRVVLTGFDAKQNYEAVVDGQPRFPVRKRLLVKRGKDALFLKI